MSSSTALTTADYLGMANLGVSGMLALTSVIPLLFIVLGGLAVFGGAGLLAVPHVLIGIVLGAILLGTAALSAAAGICVATRRRYVLCLAAALVSLTHLPFGLPVGLVTLVWLLRPDVRRSFVS